MGPTAPHILFVVGRALGHIGRVHEVAREVEGDARVSFAGLRADALDLLGPNVRPIDHPRDAAAVADQLEAVFADTRPDLICVDMSPVHISLVRFPRTPVAFMTNAFLTPLWGEVTTAENANYQKRGLDERRASRGLSPLRSSKDLYLVDDVILCDPIGILPPAAFAGPYRPVGAVAWEPSASLPPGLTGDRHLAACFGSTGRDRPPPGLVDRLRVGLGCDTTVWVGGMPGGSVGPTDVEIMNAPFSAVCADAPLAITQGGAGSTYLALRAGLPVAVHPSHRSHELMADVLRSAGVGASLAELAAMGEAELAATVARMSARLATLEMDPGGVPAARGARDVLFERLARN